MHDAAVGLLARREHSARELITKLVRRGFDAGEVEAQVQRLAEAGLQSDARFAELYAEQRVRRGDGPLKIRAALSERGIPGELVDDVLEAHEDEWTERARDALAKRFGLTLPASRPERARWARFLRGRGFPAAVVYRVTTNDDDEQ